MAFTSKIRMVLSQTSWYHATTRSNFENIRSHGIIADYNRGRELDFGFGFYLTPSAELAESYIARLLGWAQQEITDVPVIMEYHFTPIAYFENDLFQTAVFPKFDDEFAQFVFTNRLECGTQKQQHAYDLIYGVMSDSAPTTLLLSYRAGDISKEDVLEGLKKSNRMKQLSVHNQELCDALILTRAYEFDIQTNKRKELDIHE